MLVPDHRSVRLLVLAGLVASTLALDPSANAPVGAASANSTGTRVVVAEASDVSIDDSFEIRHYEVSLDPSAGDAEVAVEPGVGQSRAATSVVVELEGAPEMVILDRVVGAQIVSLRSRNDGRWSDWVEVSTDVRDAPDGIAGGEGSGARVVGSAGPVWLGDATEAVEIIGVDAALGSLRVESLHSLDGATAAAATAESNAQPEVEGGSPVVGNAVVGNAVSGKPVIQPRTAWTGEGWATQNAGCTGGPTYSDTLRAAIVHHTVNANDYGADQSDDLLRGIYRYHTNTQGWCDIAYNFIIDRFGTIFEARLGGIDRPVVGGHTRGFNTWTVGIALLGQHQHGASPAAVDPPPATVESLRQIVAWKLGLYGVDPLGTTWLKNRSSGSGMKFAAGQWVEVPTVLGHRDLGESSCPGSRAYPLVGALPGQLAPVGQQVGAAPYVFPAWQGDRDGAGAIVVDSAGGVRPAMSAGAIGPAPTVGAGAVAIAGFGTAGYVLAGSGELRAYGGAPAVGGRPAGSAVVVDLAASSAGGGWILTADGALVRFGGAPERSSSGRTPAGAAVAVSLDGGGNGYIVDRSGSLVPVGSAPPPSPAPAASTAVDVAVRPDGRSGWVLDSSSNLIPFGGAPSVTLTGSRRSAPRALVGSDTGYGGWVLDAEGRLLAFGLVPYAGSVSTTVGSAIAVDAATVGYRIDPAQAASPDAKFVAALYRTFIGTTATPALLDHWVWRLDETGGDRVASELASSDEWAGAVVRDIYATALGRQPDDDGRRYWVAQLRDGLRVQDLGTYFYGSSEHYAKAGSPGAYVDLLYQELLGRGADPVGRSYWVSELSRGVSPAGVAGGFYASLESRRDRVARLFVSVLGRDPDPGGHEYWADWLVSRDDIDLAAGLASSEEYYLRATR